MEKKITISGFISYQIWLVFFLTLLSLNYLQGQTFCRAISQTNSKVGLIGGISNPDNVFDDDPNLTTYASISSGLASSVEETLTLNQTVKAGDKIILYLSANGGLLDLGLLTNVSIQAKLSNTNVGSSVALNNALLNVSLVPGKTIQAVEYTFTGNADKIQIRVSGILDLSVLRVYDARLEFVQPTVTGGLNKTICSGDSTTIIATPAVATSLAWYNSATSTSAIITGNSFTTPILTTNTTYYIGVIGTAGCESSERIPVVINVSNPIAPTIDTAGTVFCSSGATQQTTLSVINPIPGTTYNWYSVATAGTILASGTSYSPTVSVGTTSFYVEASIGSCNSATRTQVDVISTATPALPTVLTQSVTIQSGQNATLSATTAEAGVTLNWYDVPTAGVVLASNTPNFTTPILTATKTYYVEAQSATGNCVSVTRVPVTVSVITTPLGGCLDANTQQTNLNGLCLLCGSTTPNSSVDGSTATAARLTIPIGLINGWIQQTLQFNNPGKTGDIINVELGLPGGVLDLTALSYITLATYNGATFNNDKVSINNLLNVQLLVGNRFKASITAGANFDRVEIRLGGLATVLTSLDIYQASYQYKAPTISGTTTICSGQNTTLTASLSVGETATWYDAPTAGTLLVSTAAYTTPNLTTATTYYVAITRNGCVSTERFPVLVNITNTIAPTIDTAGTVFCSSGATQQTTLSVINPIPGTTYNWYSVATAGTILASGTSYSPTVSVGTTSFYIEASIGSCNSATRTQVDVVSTATPALPTVLTQSVTIQSGQNASLSATTAEAGVTLNWYDVPTTGVVLASNTPNFTTPILTATKTYYVEAQSATGNCVSVTRVPVTVSVITTPLGGCLDANTQQTNLNGLCLLCGSTTPNSSVDGNTATAARLTIPIGLINGWIQQTLQFNNPGKTGDIINVELGLPGGVLDLTALSYITLATYNGATFNNDKVSINNLLNVQLLGGNRFKASITAGANFDRVEIRLGGLATVLNSLDIYQASYQYKAPTISGTTTVCSGQNTTLTASLSVGETATWYDAPTAGTLLVSTTAYTTPNLTTATTYYVAITRNGCVSTERFPVLVNITNTIAPTIDTAGTVFCSSGATQQTTLSVINPIPGTTYNWYSVATAGTILASGTSYSPTVSLGTTSFYIEASIGSCNSATRTQVDVVSTATPALPTVLTQSVTIQSGQNASLSATTAEAGVTLNWYDVPTAGVVLASNTPTFTTPILTATKTYYVEAQSPTGNCVSVTRVPVTVSVITTPLGGCLDANTQQTNLNGLCILCGSTTPNSSVDGSTATAARLTIPIGLINGWIQQTLQFNNPGKTGDIINVELGLPGGVLDLTALSYITLATYNGATFNNDKVSINNLLNVQLLGGNRFKASITAGANFDRVEIRLGGLATVLTSLDIYQASYQYKAPTISGTTTICSGQNTTLTASLSVGETATWYDAPTAGTLLVSTAAYTTPNLTTATTYYVAITRNGCVSTERFPVLVNITNTIAPTIDTAGTVFCSSGATQQTTLSVINPIPGTTYNWYSVATAGTILASGTSYSPTVSVGTTSFYVEASIGSCNSATRTQVDVVSTATPALPTVLTQSVTIQSGQNASLSATTAEAGVTLNWYDVPTAGVVLASNTPTFTTPILTATKTYYVEAQSPTGNCVSVTRVPVTVSVITTPLGGCLDANTQQTNLNGLCILCGSTTPNSSVDGNTATAARLTIPIGLINGWIQQTLQFNNPGKTGDIINVELGLPGGVLDLTALSYITLATYNGATFNNDKVSINNLLNVQLLGGNRFKASITAGANFDRVEIRLGGLATVLTSLDIYQASYQYKAPTISGTTTICSGQNTTLTAGLSVGETAAWYDAPTAGTLLVSAAAYTTPNLTTGTTYYVAITRNGCVSTERFPVLVNVTNPIAPTIAVGGTTICSGQTTTLNINAPVIGTNYKWFTTATAGTLLFTGNSFTTSVLNANTTYYVEAEIGSCSSTTRTQIDVIVNPTPLAPTVASSNVSIQSGQSALLEVINPEAGVNYDWFSAAVGGSSLATATEFTTPLLLTTTTYYIEASGTTSGCINTTRTPVTVIVNKPITSCLLAVNQTISNDGILCLACGAVPGTEALSIDTDFNTATTLQVPIAVAGYVQQKIDFSTSGLAGDIIDIELGIPTGTLDISALSYISLQSYDGGTVNTDGITINSLLNIQLLGGNRFRASFVAGGNFTGVQVRLGGSATIATDLNIYGASFKYKEVSVSGADSPICSGKKAILVATPLSGETVRWYTAASGGGLLSSTADYTTPALTTTTIYYIETTRGTCDNSVRQPVTVTVFPLATAASVIITSPQEASCNGGIVLSPTSALGGAQFKYYTDQIKTQEITSGTNVVTQPGVTFSKNLATGALTISGLTAGSSYNYYVSVSNGSTCENDNNTLKLVTITAPTSSSLTVISPLIGCGSVNLKDAIEAFDTSGNTTYNFFDPSNSSITAEAAANVTLSGIYSIQAQITGAICPSVKSPVTVTVNSLPTLNVTPSISVSAGTSVPLTATSDGTLTWFNPQGALITGPSFSTGILNTPGVYTYTVVASNGTCSRTGTVSINVIDTNGCQLLTQRVYANTQSSGSNITGGVSNGTNAVDGNPLTNSTIVTGVGLLGIGTTWQNLKWSANIVKGTPVTVKLGSEYSAVTLGQNLSVIGTKSGVDIGTLQPVSGALLNGLSGDNVFEFTFVPANASGPQDYDGIRIQSASLASVAQSIKVYDAYYNKSVSTITCTPGDIQDIFYGSTTLGVGAVTATIGVSEPWNVADNDITTFTTMYSGVSVLAAADLTIAFKTPSIASDTLRIVVSKPSVPLDVNLLRGFSIQRYLGNVPVGAPILNTSTFLTLQVLPGNTMSMVLVNSQPEPYDRVRIRLGGVAGVLDLLRVHTVERVADTKVIGSDSNNKVTVCPGTAVTLQIPQKSCSTYKWYDAPTGGNVVATGVTYPVLATFAAGIYKYYVQPVRYDCETFARGEVIVEVRPSSPENALTDITLNGGVTTSICSPSGTITLATSPSGAPVLTNPIYYWYRFNGTSMQLIPGATTSQLTVNSLIPGTYTYYVGVSSNDFCETVTTDRKQITFTILPPSKTNDISTNDAIICSGEIATLTPTVTTLTNPVFYWYLNTNKTQPITNGAIISGITYTISATGVLTASGVTHAMGSITYYVGVSSDTTCENIAGTLQTANIIVNDPSTPTTTASTQGFCLVNTPKVSNIQVNESNVVWYSTSTGGTAITPTTALTNGDYYGAILDPVTNCVSSVRLKVTVNVTNPATPTTTASIQNFCLVNTPKVSNIQINESNVIWYKVATGGTAIVATTPLTNGDYYGAILDPITNCESSVRLKVTITVTDPVTPTTIASIQNFCLVNTPKVSSIQVNEGNVIWYKSITGGAALAATTALTSGDYYGVIKDPITNCESSVRLKVTINVNNPATPTTTALTQIFCFINAPKISNIQVNESNVIWYKTATGGTVIAPTTALTSGDYYGAILDPVTNCESSVRLKITISITNPVTPTTMASTQNFCLINSPKVSNIQVNEGNVIWYNAMTGGTLISTTTALMNGDYFGAIKDLVTNCESSVRLKVTINVTNPATPTTTASTQNFCLINTPKVSSIQVNESNVIWYKIATGGTAIAATTALTSGDYYGVIKDPITNCESSVRLKVTINVNNSATPTTTALTQIFCLINTPKVSNIQVNESNVVWYNSVTGGTAIASTTALISGDYFGAIKDPVTNCESSVRLKVTINVTNPTIPTTTTATQNFCLVNTPKVSNIQVNESNVVWYKVATGGTAIVATTALTNGDYYGAILNPITNCESSVRLKVTVTITDPATPTTTASIQNFCLVNVPKISNIQVNESNIIWYNVMAGGTAIASTTALISGDYYGAIEDPVTNCESSVRLKVTINITDPATPTTTASTQGFCLINTPKVSNIQVNESNVVWYNAVTGGTAIASTTALISGDYFGAIKNPVTNCESSVRLKVTVNVTDPVTPTTTSATQNFCLVNAPKVSSIQVNESNVIWYKTVTGGVAIAPTTALTSGNYYGAIKDPVTNCESSIRLKVTINVTNPVTPTTTASTQNFCLVNAPKISSIQVNESNVIWYKTVTGGVAIAPTTTLISGNYYGAILDLVTNCESSVRLKVTISVTNPATPTTTASTQGFCLINTPKVSNIQVNESNVVWYNTMTGGTVIASTTALINGDYFGAILDPVTNCESSVRLKVTVNVTNPATPTTTAATQNFCLVNAPKISNIQVNESNVVWYKVVTGGTAITATTALTSGDYYGVILDPVTNCESSVRLKVTINVTDPTTPTTTATTQSFCLINTPKISNIQVNESNVVWYKVVTGGAAIAVTTDLTSGDYYGAILDPITNCESSVRLKVVISVTNPATPTTTAANQGFCLINTPKVSNIQVNENNVVWYNAMIGGTAIASTTALINGDYFGAILDPVTNCESSLRLKVTISVTNPATPTTTATTQNFCLVNAPKIADIQVNESNVVWYKVVTGGTAITATTALTSGDYYGVILDPVTNCESSVRLKVTINVTDPTTPTTTATSQSFCLINTPKISNIQVNESNVVWYKVVTGGAAIAVTTDLTSGDYYGAILDPITNCESSVRLKVVISVTNPATPTTTAANQGFCLINTPKVSNIQVNESNVVWYNTMTGGTVIASTTALINGDYFGAILDPVTNCESSLRLKVTISVTNPATPTTTATTQNFCLVNAPKIADIQVNESNVVWYKVAIGGTVILPTTALTNGDYYGIIKDPVTNCESSVRLKVTIKVTNPVTPTTTASTQSFCLINAPKISNIQVNENNVVWYKVATGGEAISSTTALTSGDYYGALLDPVTNCESSIRLKVTINITDPGTPTTTASTQGFCLINAPKIANIQVNEGNVIWYNAVTGGIAIPTNTALVTGDYFGVIKDPITNCESSVRLKITVNVSNPVTPTTTTSTQGFCLINAPKVANIQVNESNVVWYKVVTGGTAILATTALTTGDYYGAIKDPITNCESSVRLKVIINVTDPATPTTTASTQGFCLINAPTIANIQVNESNVVWYKAVIGGTAIVATTALTSGDYYGAIKDPITKCESSIRLKVTVNVNAPTIPTTPKTTQTFCPSAIATIADLEASGTNLVWYTQAIGGTPLALNTTLTPKTYYVAATTLSGCESLTRLAITVEFENSDQIQISSTNDTPCVFNGVTYSIANGKSNYVWTITGGTILSGGGTADGSVTVSWSNIGAGQVKVTYTNTCDENTTKTLDITAVTCSDLTITNIVNNPAPNFGEEVEFTITISNVGEGNMINTQVNELLPNGYDFLSFTASVGTYDPANHIWNLPTLNAGTSQILKIKALVLSTDNYMNVASIIASTPLDLDSTNNTASSFVEPICLTVYNEFTPNNDGANDLFRIDCIESYPNNELEVYNRYGSLVYKKNKYENDWNGTANVSGVVNKGDMLPTGTYFYVINIGDGTVKKGWLSIVR
ncbi:gliding motility-associated C-terminal domain-containing protein [Flavobacterium sp. 5]|uniref:Ig-like domain-containing protein n=1 Tax=Flavobacterium sp. 5 TaxID=2035199 RepID=UPI000C2C3874|nr:gliding motility-associated C-terminal domain-containing protein [Flavobacterium sp. 5]PKB18740.1 gliding motility-associated-like protein [Flavobacterium sp. 5]